jgi:hypothetical protein
MRSGIEDIAGDVGRRYPHVIALKLPGFVAEPALPRRFFCAAFAQR